MSSAMTHALPDPVTQAEFYADIPTKRFLAWIVDAAVILVICLVALPFTAFLGLFFFPVLWVVLGFLYRWTTISGRSATWGMRLVAIEFRDLHGARLDSTTAFAHTLVYTAAVSTFFLQVLSVVLILMTPRRQSLSDHLLGTVAINRAAAA
jgi:uncharacterized RDD family membrane protein YckC